MILSFWFVSCFTFSFFLLLCFLVLIPVLCLSFLSTSPVFSLCLLPVFFELFFHVRFLVFPLVPCIYFCFLFYWEDFAPPYVFSWFMFSPCNYPIMFYLCLVVCPTMSNGFQSPCVFKKIVTENSYPSFHLWLDVLPLVRSTVKLIP